MKIESAKETSGPKVCETIPTCIHSILLVSVLVPQTANSSFDALLDAVRLVQVSVVGCRDVGVLGIITSNCCWVTLVERTLTLLLLVVLSQRSGVLHLNSTVIVNPVGAECAIEGERVALASDIIWIVVLWSHVST
jgi:hypothetical protein